MGRVFGAFSEVRSASCACLDSFLWCIGFQSLQAPRASRPTRGKSPFRDRFSAFIPATIPAAIRTANSVLHQSNQHVVGPERGLPSHPVVCPRRCTSARVGLYSRSTPSAGQWTPSAQNHHSTAEPRDRRSTSSPSKHVIGQGSTVSFPGLRQSTLRVAFGTVASPVDAVGFRYCLASGKFTPCIDRPSHPTVPGLHRPTIRLPAHHYARPEGAAGKPHHRSGPEVVAPITVICIPAAHDTHRSNKTPGNKHFSD